MTEESLYIEEKVTSRFKCRDRQLPPIDFKDIEILKENGRITLSQTAYAAKMMIEYLKQVSIMKMDKYPEINNEEVETVRSDAGKLAWLATKSALLASFQASFALQGEKNNPRAIQTLINTRNTPRSTHSSTQPLFCNALFIHRYDLYSSLY